MKDFDSPILYIYIPQLIINSDHMSIFKLIPAVNIPSTSLWTGGVETAVVVMVVSGSSGVVWTCSMVLKAVKASVATGLPDPSPGGLSFRRCCRFSRLLTLVSQLPDRYNYHDNHVPTTVCK